MGLWGTIDTQSSAEGPKCSQNDPTHNHLQCIKILEWVVQMPNISRDMAVWGFRLRLTDKNSAEGPKFSQNDPSQSHLQRINILK